jgi:hypothetical protein
MAESPSVAVIGSFRQHYAPVLDVWREFTAAGWSVTSPKGAPIIEEGIEFVRFESDPADWDDPMVQTVALHRILRADLVYVVAPDGYVGRTTCYEIGRVLQADRPLYFSELPKDLPLEIPADHVLALGALIEFVARSPAVPLYTRASSRSADLEQRLVRGDYRDV